MSSARFLVIGILYVTCRQTECQMPLYGYEDPTMNLVNNFDFEYDINAATDWKLQKSDLEYVSDAHTGNRSIRLHNRKHKDGGVLQKIYNVERNKSYYLSAFVKTLNNDPNDMFFDMRLWVKYFETGAGKWGRTPVAKLVHIRESSIWRQIGGDFTTPDIDIDYISVYLEVMYAWAVEYLLDTVSLIRIPEDPQWQEKSEEAIRTHRKNNVTISTVIPDGIPYSDCNFKVDQTRKGFGFGNAIQSERFAEQTVLGENYRQFFFNYFTWATFVNTMKWKPMEWKKGNIKYDRVDTAIVLLEDENIDIRAHSLLWGNQNNNPNWAQNLTGLELYNETNRRIDYFVGHYKDKVVHYDINNEWLHNIFYEEKTGDHLFTDAMFNRTRDLDPTGKLFINDYKGLRAGDYTSAFVDQFEQLTARGVSVYGMGVQSHLKDPVTPEILKKRLDILTARGAPVVITELTVHSADVQERADRLDMALRIYFSHPGVEEILFWSFSDQAKLGEDPDKTLFEGENFTANVAGQVLLDRLSDWETHLEFEAADASVAHTFEAFHGDYDIELHCENELVTTESFTLSPGSDLVVDVVLTASMFPISNA